MVAVVQVEDADECRDALSSAGFGLTRIDSHGAFLESRNVTLLIGIDDSEVEPALEIIRGHARRRVSQLQSALAMPAPLGMLTGSVDVEVGGATVFVLPLERCEKL